MNFKFNYNSFDLCDIPVMTLCKPSTEQVGIISNVSELNINPKFNAVSEISFRTDRTSDKTDTDINKIYDLIKTKKQILVQDIGYFIITNVETYEEEKLEYKTISGVSCEIEISMSETPYLKGTYKFYNSENPTDTTTMMGLLMAKIPNWNIKAVDNVVADKSRTFDTMSNIFNFMMNDLEESYECLFEFDTLNREITICDKIIYTLDEQNQTTILLSSEDVIDSLTTQENSEELATVLNVSGGNDLVISSVNPLGGNLIYNFKYYKTTEWMSQSTIDAITAWEQKIASYSSIGGAYYLKKEEYNAKKNELSSAESLLYDVYEVELKGLQTQKSNTIVQGQSLATINGLITTKQNQINTQKDVIETLTSELSVIQSALDSISNDLAIQNTANFTIEQQQELSYYMYTSDFSEETISRTEDISYTDEQARATELYDKATLALDKIHEPITTFSVKTNSFVFSKHFKHFADQLKTGCLIDIIIKNSQSNPEVVTLILLNLDINFEDFTCELTFGNRYKNKDPMSLYNDFYSQTNKATNSVSWNKDMWQLTSSKVPDLVSFTKEPLSLATNAVLSGDGQSIQIDDNGYWGKKFLEDGNGDFILDVNGEKVISPEQVRIINNVLAFTDDGFNSAKTAIGKVTLPEGQLIDGKNYVYGIAAEHIVGNLILGDKAVIESTNSSGEVVTTIDNKGLTIQNGGIQIKNKAKEVVFGADTSGYIYASRVGSLVNTNNYIEAGLNTNGNRGLFVYDKSVYIKPYFEFWLSAENHSVISAMNKLVLRLNTPSGVGSFEFLAANQNGINLCTTGSNGINIYTNGVTDETSSKLQLTQLGASIYRNLTTEPVFQSTQDYTATRWFNGLKNTQIVCLEDQIKGWINGYSAFKFLPNNVNFYNPVYINGEFAVVGSNVTHLAMVTGSSGKYLEMSTTSLAYGVYVWQSDQRLKYNINNSNINAIDTIKKIKHREFNWKSNDLKTNIGYIAQELQDIISDAVFEVKQPDDIENDFLYQVNTSAIIPYITKAIQEQQIIIEQQQTTIDNLELRLKALEDKINGITTNS